MAHVGAFFDVDDTVLRVNTGSRWVRRLWGQGHLSWGEGLRALRWMVGYRLSLLDFEAVVARAASFYAGQDIETLAREVEAWFFEEIEPAIAPQALERIDMHRSEGHTLVLLTSAYRVWAAPLAQRLGIEHVVCTELEEREGRLTGRHIPPACYGAGKLMRAQAFAERHAIDLDESYYYADSLGDLPMLQRVGHPVAVNPDPRLRWHVRRLGWPSERWA